LEVLLAVEEDITGLDLAVFAVNFVTNQDDRDVFTNTDQILVPVRNRLVSNTRGNIEHDDGAVTTNVVTITKTTELFLTGL
jgi:hypothetical protein